MVVFYLNLKTFIVARMLYTGGKGSLVVKGFDQLSLTNGKVAA